MYYFSSSTAVSLVKRRHLYNNNGVTTMFQFTQDPSKWVVRHHVEKSDGRDMTILWKQHRMSVRVSTLLRFQASSIHESVFPHWQVNGLTQHMERTPIVLFHLKMQNQNQVWNIDWHYYKVQAALVICGLFTCDFAYSHFKIGQKWQFSSQKWTFYKRIQDSRSKIVVEHIHRELQWKPVPTCIFNLRFRVGIHKTS